MNGDLGKIYKAIHQVELKVEHIHTKQVENHRENKEKLGKLDDLSCKVHVEKLSNLDKDLTRLRNVVMGVVVGGIVLGIWIKLVLAN